MILSNLFKNKHISRRLKHYSLMLFEINFIPNINQKLILFKTHKIVYSCTFLDNYIDMSYLNLKIFLFSIISFLIFPHCSYDSEENLYGVTLCDTSYLSFALDISPIVADHCSPCHGGTSSSAASAGLLLVTHSQIKSSATDPSISGMINRVSRLEGDPLMMPSSYRIPQCQINKIIAWVNQGSLNN